MSIPGYLGVDPVSMLGADLRPDRLPDWVRVECLHRIARMRPGMSWHALYRMCLDVSDLPIMPRTAARVLVDMHGTDATTVLVQVRDIARRMPATRQKTSQAVSGLVADGWLSRVTQAGKASILTLMVPMQPVTHGDTPPVTHGDRGVTHGDTGCHPRGHHQGKGAEGQSQGHVAFSSQTRSRAVSADPWAGYHAP